MEHYILDGKIPVLCKDVLTWAQWLETAERRVAYTEIAEDVKVSTVFLGLNHNWDGGIPLLFETMVFYSNDAMDNEMDRYHSWHQAEQGHEAMCAKVWSNDNAATGECIERPHPVDIDMAMAG